MTQPTLTTPLNRQQLCVALGVSESTVRRLELLGLPFTPVGIRAKRYDLDECKAWLRTHQHQATPHQQPCPSGKTNAGGTTSVSWSTGSEYIARSRRTHLRVMPSSSKPN